MISAPIFAHLRWTVVPPLPAFHLESHLKDPLLFCRPTFLLSPEDLGSGSAREQGGVNTPMAVLWQWVTGVGGEMSQAPDIQKDS